MTPLFDDWKRFYFVLREIAGGQGGRPMSGLNRARAVLIECGCPGPGKLCRGECNPRPASERERMVIMRTGHVMLPSFNTKTGRRSLRPGARDGLGKHRMDPPSRLVIF